MTSDLAAADELVAVRRLALPSLEKQGRVLTEDIAVPRSKLAEAVTAIDGIAERHQVAVAILAHAGDGNLNPIFVIDQSDDRSGAGLGGGGCLRTGVAAGRHLDR